LSSKTTIISRSEHNISRSHVSPNALKVLYRLHNEGFRACLVGGCVRDMLLGLHPKDFDVATDAHPEEIRRLFDNCRLIGRRFRLAHVLFGRDVIEVATFRGQTDDDDESAALNSENGRILRDNVYGNIDQDVWRRDFTMNALYYDIADFSLVDYVGAMDDIRKRVIRLIGEPAVRYREDPVRMLRAVRFAAKLDFTIDPSSAEPIRAMGHLLLDMPAARLFDETLKLFHTGHALRSFQLLRHYGLLKYLFPALDKTLSSGHYQFATDFIQQALHNTDLRVQQEKSVTPAFLYAAFLWTPLLEGIGYRLDEPLLNLMDMQKTAGRLLEQQARHTAVPRRFTAVTREIWLLQAKLQRNKGRRVLRLLTHPRFRAAYDLLCLRAQTGENVREFADWWTDIQVKTPQEQQAMAEPAAPAGRKRRRRRRGRGMRQPRENSGAA
jgi:poly(A) polymerase